MSGVFFITKIFSDRSHNVEVSHGDVMPVQVIYITALFLFIAIFPLPFEFYSFLKIVVAGTFAWGAYKNFGKKMFLLPLVYTLFALLYNPIMEINMAKEFWMPVDLAGAVILLLTKKHIAE
ncbi:MAG: DUF6804 family protein [Chlorobiaceae bacterium]